MTELRDYWYHRPDGPPVAISRAGMPCIDPIRERARLQAAEEWKRHL